MVSCRGAWCDCVSSNDLGYNSHSGLFGDSAMYHGPIWGWRTDYVDNVSRCDFGEYYVSGMIVVRVIKLVICIKYTRYASMCQWMMTAATKMTATAIETHTERERNEWEEVSEEAALFQTYEYTKKGLSAEPFQVFLFCENESQRVCEDGVTSVVRSLTSAINFRHENFCSCFPFDLFYLRKL